MMSLKGTLEELLPSPQNNPSTVTECIPCTQPTVRQNNTEILELEAEKSLLQRHTRRQVAYALKPQLLQGFQQSLSIEKMERGVASCCKLLGIIYFLLAAVHVGKVMGRL